MPAGRLRRAALEALAVAAVLLAAVLFLHARLEGGCGRRTCDPRDAEPPSAAWAHAWEYAAAVTFALVGLRVLLAVADGPGARRQATLLALGAAAVAAGAVVGVLASTCTGAACQGGHTPSFPWTATAGSVACAAGLAVTWSSAGRATPG